MTKEENKKEDKNTVEKDTSYPLSPKRLASRLESISASEELIQELLLKLVQDDSATEKTKSVAHNYLSSCQAFLDLIKHQVAQPTYCRVTDTLVTIIFLVISSCTLKPALPTVLLPIIDAIISKEERNDRD